MSEAPEPDWSRLPDDPAAFFGLEEGYERKTLKRAYTRLIKRFKPETRPDEFRPDPGGVRGPGQRAPLRRVHGAADGRHRRRVWRGVCRAPNATAFARGVGRGV